MRVSLRFLVSSARQAPRRTYLNARHSAVAETPQQVFYFAPRFERRQEPVEARRSGELVAALERYGVSVEFVC